MIEKPLTKKMIKYIFKSTTKKSSLMRSDYIEFLLRLAFEISSDNESYTQTLQKFLNIYVVPQFYRSNIIKLRKNIQKNKEINKLFYLNSNTLKRLFNESGSFDLISAQNLFPEIERTKIQQLFVTSKRTVLDEKRNKSDYNQLIFLEFLEFLSRIAELNDKELTL